MVDWKDFFYAEKTILSTIRYLVMKPIIAFCLALFAGVAAGQLAAQQTDPHVIYERNCARCHTPHAGDFVAADVVEDETGVLIGRTTDTPVAEYLKRGHGRLPEAEIGILIDQFVAIANAGGLFREKCRICHERAAGLARSELVLRDGDLYGRYTDRDISLFLRTHGRLHTGEIPVIVEMLKRALAVE